MCGFGGIIGARSISYTQLEHVAAQVNYRGPDYTGMRIYDHLFSPVQDSGSAGFFHNRLSIIDIDERSNQPFEDDGHILLFNGEIYNFLQLKKELTSFGYVFRTKSDTEVLFIALKHWGEAAIPKLNGMFAFAFVNKKKRQVLLGRDRLGIKPLYYDIQKETICFASEVDSIIRLMGRVPPVDLNSVAQYSILQYVPGNRSIWGGVLRVEPGTYLNIHIDIRDNRKIKVSKYWDAYEAAQKNTEGIDLKVLLSEVVTEQLVADVPIGVSLSSGVDSSLLAALISRKHQDATVKYYSVGFNDAPENDESAKAKRYLGGLGVEESAFVRLALNSNAVGSLWKSLYRFVDEPLGDQSILLNWAISTEASKHVKVMLSGDGADEIFVGYDRYRDWQGFCDYSRVAEVSMRLLSLVLKKKGLMIRSDPNLLIRYLLMLDPGANSARRIESVFDEFLGQLGIDGLLHRPDLPRLMDIKSYLPGAMLFKVDRASMAAGVEVRVPFLDNRIVETGLSFLSLSRDKPLKWRLREILGEFAPHYDLAAPKRGLSLPLFRWMRESWKTLIYEIYSEADFEALGLDRNKSVNSLKSFYAGNDAVGYYLWIQANLILWHRTKLDQFR